MSRSLQDIAAKLTEKMRDELKLMKFDATDEEIDQAERSLLNYVESLIAPIIGSLSSVAPPSSQTPCCASLAMLEVRRIKP
ncbi:minor capsid protein [Shigella phage vB_SsoS_008]|nr:minor capsid protein [Shigella phage vB_SsoS_008]